MKKQKSKLNDFDKDGLSDEEEALFKTSVFSKDTDRDGLSDFEEIFIYGTDPKNNDTDGDGIPDGAEVAMGRNPKGPGKLKNFLIPHQGNNYHPASFDSKRIAFHATSAVVIKVFVFIFLAILPEAAWLTPDVLFEQENQIVVMTNEMRKDIGIEILKDNQDLKKAAFGRAQDMMIKNYFAHTSPEGYRFSKWIDDVGYRYSVAGENLAIGFSDAKSAMEGWKASPTHYDNLIDPDYEEIGVSAVSGFFGESETVLVAQLFGARQNIFVSDSSEYSFMEDSSGGQNAQVLDEKSFSNDVYQEVSAVSGYVATNEENLFIDDSKSNVLIEEKDGNDIALVSAIVFASFADRVDLFLGGRKIELFENIKDRGEWSGSAIIFKEDYDKVFSPTVPPYVLAYSQDGNFIKKDIPLEGIVKANPSALDKYLFIKNHNSGFVGAINRISKGYFGAMAILGVIALILMVFVEIKKQKPGHALFGFFAIALFFAAFYI